MLANATLVYGEIGFVDYSHLRTEIRVHQLIEHQSTGHTPVGHESHVIRVPIKRYNSFQPYIKK